MAKQQIVTGSGNTAKLGVTTVSAGVTILIDEATTANTIIGSGQTNIDVTFGTSTATSTYYTGGGSGTVSGGGGNDLVVLSGTKWLFQGNQAGADTINSSAGQTTISTYGNGNANLAQQSTVPSNAVYLSGGAATVNSDGTNDLIESYGGKDLVTMYNGGHVLVNGGAVTVEASGSATVDAYFAGKNGGTLDFIGNGSVAATVSGNVPGGIGGSVTAFGGVGGGVFIGASGGNNSLIGGIGDVTLEGAGNNNLLLANGYSGSYAQQNVLLAGAGTATLEASSNTGYDEFVGGTGTDVISSAGSGAQTYYVGAKGSESITGSQAAGATNEYIFNQDTTGAGTDVITNFKLGKDHLDINLNGPLTGVTFTGDAALAGATAGTILYLSDHTVILLYGVAKSSISASIFGGTHL
jgi:hypothetical protein